MTAKQLTDSILQLAIQGKLVPQDPNDEPASILLDRIREKKEKLVKEGVLKKAILDVTPIKEEDYPFSIPDSWEWIRLNYVSDIARGGSPRPIKEFLTDAPNGVNWIKISDSEIGGKYIYSTKEKIKPEGVSRSRYVHVDDFLLTNSMSFGRPYILKTEGCIHDGWLVISLDKNSYDQDFMYYLLSSRFAKKSFTDKAAGAVVKNLNIDKVAESIFPLPPLAEQRRIVDRIEDFLPLIKEYGEAYDEASKMDAELPDKLKKSILQEAIKGKLGTQDPNDEPASVLMEQIREEKKRLVKEGVLKKKDLEENPVEKENVPQNIIDGWEYVKLAFVTSLIDGTKREGEYVCLDAKFLRGKSTGEKIPKGKYVEKGDNIILVDGENSGEVFTVPCDGYMGSTFKQLWVSDNLFLPYVLYFIKAYKDILRNSKKGAAIPHLNKDIFYNLVIGIPPLAEQRRIVEKIEVLFAEIDNMTINKDINETEIEETEY